MAKNIYCKITGQRESDIAIMAKYPKYKSPS